MPSRAAHIVHLKMCNEKRGENVRIDRMIHFGLNLLLMTLNKITKRTKAIIRMRRHRRKGGVYRSRTHHDMESSVSLDLTWFFLFFCRFFFWFCSSCHSLCNISLIASGASWCHFAVTRCFSWNPINTNLVGICCLCVFFLSLWLFFC